MAVPSYRKSPLPAYPKVARRRGWEGLVLLRVRVDARGRPREIRLAQSSGHEVLDRAAMRAVKGWLFDPARKGGHPVETWVTIPIRFTLKGAFQ